MYPNPIKILQNLWCATLYHFIPVLNLLHISKSINLNARPSSHGVTSASNYFCLVYFQLPPLATLLSNILMISGVSKRNTFVHNVDGCMKTWFGNKISTILSNPVTFLDLMPSLVFDAISLPDQLLCNQ